jgi:hypothetical protein
MDKGRPPPPNTHTHTHTYTHTKDIIVSVNFIRALFSFGFLDV